MQDADFCFNTVFALSPAWCPCLVSLPGGLLGGGLRGAIWGLQLLASGLDFSCLLCFYLRKTGAGLLYIRKEGLKV